MRARAKNLRARGITQASIARMARVSVSMVSHYLAGRTRSARLDALTTMLLERADGA